jgi:hypothetical protein
VREQYFKLDIPYKVNKKTGMTSAKSHQWQKASGNPKISRGKYVYNPAYFIGDDLVHPRIHQ